MSKYNTFEGEENDFCVAEIPWDDYQELQREGWTLRLVYNKARSERLGILYSMKKELNQEIRDIENKKI